jgi:hypothetical protein
LHGFEAKRAKRGRFAYPALILTPFREGRPPCRPYCNERYAYFGDRTLAHPFGGPRKLPELYHRQYARAASESSFKRVLERSGLNQKRGVRVATQSGRLCSGRQAQEPNQDAERDMPADAVTVTKKAPPKRRNRPNLMR